MGILRGLGGLLGLVVIAWALSEDRRRVPWRVVGAGILLQISLALLIKLPPVASAFLLLNDGVGALQKATDAGTAFVFGYLAGGPQPFAEIHPDANFILAFRAFPLVLVISALASLLFYWGVLQRVVQAVSWLFRRTIGIGGPTRGGRPCISFGAHVSTAVCLCVLAHHVADRHSRARDRNSRNADGHQDRAQRIRRLCRTRAFAGHRR